MSNTLKYIFHIYRDIPYCHSIERYPCCIGKFPLCVERCPILYIYIAHSVYIDIPYSV